MSVTHHPAEADAMVAELSDASIERPLGPALETSLFWRLRRTLLANMIRQTLNEARLRMLLATTLTAILWAGLFVVFLLGFQFLATTLTDPATRDETVRAVYSVFFASLLVMLVISNAIILYSGLYRSDEARFLFTTPTHDQRIFLHKFQEAILFSSWGFLLLGSPMLAAYGLVAQAGWFYYLVLVPFIVAFVYIPGSIGAIAIMLLVRYIPALRVRALVAICVVLAAAVGYLVWSLQIRSTSEMLTAGWFLEFLGRLRSAENRVLPSWWLSSGLLEASRSDGGRLPTAALIESSMFLAVTVANALALHQAAVWVAGRIYRAGYHVLAGERAPRKYSSLAWIDRAALGVRLPIEPRLRLLLVKDLRLFRRDPVQWSQFLIFFGLLGLYFVNTRRISYDVNYAAWVNMISFLNVAVVGLLLSTFTTRFIFPMISLEGRRFWILGRLPVPRERILLSKFLFAAIGSLLPCALLVLLSDLMLRVSALVVWVHLLVCVLLCSGLAGISVGLGARLPNLREESPARIAAGFGGTLNLVISAAYIVALVVMATAPCHFYLLARRPYASGTGLDPERQFWWLVAGLAGGVILGTAATVLPLRAGFKAFRELEF